MDTTSHLVEAPTPEWCQHNFDHTSPALAQNMNGTLAYMREHCPAAHSDEHGGFWVVTGYDHVMRIAQDWRTFSSAQGVGVPPVKFVVEPIPENSDPPLQQIYKRLINPYFTPAAVREHEEETRALVTWMIDEFIEAGECEFMAAFARPFPGRLFFEAFLNAPPDEAARMNEHSTTAVTPNHPGSPAAWRAMFEWIEAFVERRRQEPPRDDVVDAVLAAEIDGRPITDAEINGLIQLLILGGLDTTAGALGQFMIRFCQQPEIPDLIRRQPERLNDAVEELLRLDGPFVSIGRLATENTEIGGQQIKKGDRVVFYWASANRDPAEFERPDEFDLDRESNRHLAFGIGTHRCAGSNLARMNLRIAVDQLVNRLHHLRLQVDPAEIQYHSVHNRAPLTVPISFTPPQRLTTTS